jgi:ElaB/YqjD/DUF883 family membrane-anchored ribosome-binding protein
MDVSKNETLCQELRNLLPEWHEVLEQNTAWNGKRHAQLRARILSICTMLDALDGVAS